MILDTVVLPELRKRDTSPQVIRWLTGYQDRDLFVNIVSISEIERGIEKKRTTDLAFAALLTRWIEDLLRLYGDRILPVTSAIARRWGNLSAGWEMIVLIC